MDIYQDGIDPKTLRPSYINADNGQKLTEEQILKPNREMKELFEVLRPIADDAMFKGKKKYQKIIICKEDE